MEMSTLIIIAKAFAAAAASMTLYGIASSLSNAITSIVGAMAKNPAIKDDLKGFGMLGLFMIEFAGLLLFVVIMMILVTL